MKNQALFFSKHKSNFCLALQFCQLQFLSGALKVNSFVQDSQPPMAFTNLSSSFYPQGKQKSHALNCLFDICVCLTKTTIS